MAQAKKVIFIGESTVGKTSILFRFSNGRFETNVQPTFGAGFINKDVVANDQGKTVKLFLWDTAGQERYAAMTKNFFNGTHAAVIVYD